MYFLQYSRNFEGNVFDNRLCNSSSDGNYLSCCGSLSRNACGRQEQPNVGFFERQSIAVFFKGAETMFFLHKVFGLDSMIHALVSRDDLSHGNTVNGSWMTIAAHLTSDCLCIDQVAVTRLVGSACRLVTRSILRRCVVRSECI